jgi:hypothetical protein
VELASGHHRTRQRVASDKRCRIHRSYHYHPLLKSTVLSCTFPMRVNWPSRTPPQVDGHAAEHWKLIPIPIAHNLFHAPSPSLNCQSPRSKRSSVISEVPNDNNDGFSIENKNFVCYRQQRSQDLIWKRHATDIPSSRRTHPRRTKVLTRSNSVDDVDEHLSVSRPRR